jgi:hypothetical protein
MCVIAFDETVVTFYIIFTVWDDTLRSSDVMVNYVNYPLRRYSPHLRFDRS